MPASAAQTGASVVLQQPLDVVELELRPRGIAEAAAQLLEDAADALHVDLAGDLLREIVDLAAGMHRTSERIGLLRVLPAAGALAGAVARLIAIALLHRVGETL